MNIVFIVACSFPFGEASSIRALNICRLLKTVGHSVHVIADYSSKDHFDCDVCSYESVSENKGGLYSRIKTAKKSLRALKNYCEKNAVDAVLSNAKYDRFDKLVNYCKKRGIKIYIESCEWYDFSNFKLGKIDYRYWLNEHMIRRGFKNVDGSISISKMLDEHNSSFGIPSVRIPTIMDTSIIKMSEHKKFENRKVHIAYTGHPGKSKELLKPIIAVIANNKDLRELIQFDIYGPNRKQVLVNIDSDNDLLERAGTSVIIHGRVPQNQINDIISDSDFVIFLRLKRRSSEAGFPTKLGESMANGTPVIANCTGDIGLYLKDGNNGFIINDVDEQSVCTVFRKIVSLDSIKYYNMRKNSRQTAEEVFDYRCYTGEVKKLFGDEE